MKTLREGYTTGTCATAASVASAIWQKTGQCPEYVEVKTPTDKVFNIEIVPLADYACGVIKDAGDDPDVTNGCLVISKVEILKVSGDISFAKGQGVGIVTKVGMKVPVGEPAINPVPRKMISDGLRSVIGDCGAIVTISVPEGETIAKKTFNGRLGIEGGISILGTSGVVRPMSEEAIKDSLYLELEMYRKQGHKTVAFTMGYESEKKLRNSFPEGRAVVLCSNYVGFMLDSAENLGIENVIIYGQTGKLVKLAGDIMNTHSHIADGKNEIICTHTALAGGSIEIIEKLYLSNTTEEAITILQENNLTEVWKRIIDVAKVKCDLRVHHNVNVGLIYIDNKGSELARTDNAEAIIARWCANE